MNKKQNNSAILAGIAITAILVASSLIAGHQFTQQANAQGNATSSTARPSSSQPSIPRVGQTVNWQGTVSSIPSPLAGHARDNVAVILPLRNDGGLYTGVVTYTSSKDTRVQVWNVLSGVNPGTTPIARDFGSLALSPSPNGRGFVATTEVGEGDTSGSVPFSGNALALVGRGPFIATYSVTAQATAGKVTNNLTSAAALAATAGGAASTLGGNTGTLSLGGGGGGSSGGGGGSSGTTAVTPPNIAAQNLGDGGGSRGGGGGSNGGGGGSNGGGGGSNGGGGGSNG